MRRIGRNPRRNCGARQANTLIMKYLRQTWAVVVEIRAPLVVFTLYGLVFLFLWLVEKAQGIHIK
jgi:hypothetical protein